MMKFEKNRMFILAALAIFAAAVCILAVGIEMSEESNADGTYFTDNGISYMPLATGGVKVIAPENGNYGYTSNVTIPSTAYDGSIPYQVKSIGSGAFISSSNITVTLPSTELSIEINAFKSAHNVSIVFSYDVSSIDGDSFRSASNIIPVINFNAIATSNLMSASNLGGWKLGGQDCIKTIEINSNANLSSICSGTTDSSKRLLINSGATGTAGGTLYAADRTSQLTGSARAGHTYVYLPYTSFNKWVAIGNQYTVTFNNHDGTGGPSSVYATVNLTMPSISGIPSKTGNTFNGYYSGADGSGTQYYNANGNPIYFFDGTGATTLHAYWSPNSYTVTITGTGVSVKNGGAAVPSGSSIAYGTTLTVSMEGQTGYTSKLTANGVEISAGSYSMPAENVTFNGSYTINKYTVTFKSQDGSSTLGTSTVDYGSNATYSGTTPSKSSTAQYTYTFVGWNSSTGQTSATANVLNNITSNKTVYAAFSETLNKYTVTITGSGLTVKNGDVTISSGTQVNYGTSLTVTIAPQTGYSGSITANEATISSGSSYIITENVTFNGSYTANSYNITLDRNGGNANGSAVIKYNAASVTSKTDPKYFYHSPTGYYTTGSSPTKVMNTDGTLVANISGYTDAYGKWIRTSGCTLTTEWELATYTITLRCTVIGGTNGSATVKYGDTQFSSFIPAKIKGVDVSCYMDVDSIGVVANADGTINPGVSNYTDSEGRWAPDWSYPLSITLDARNDGITYNIIFDGNGSDGGTAVSQITASYNIGYPAPACTWTKTGKMFSHWNTKSDDSGTSYDVGDTLKNLTGSSSITLYAIWDNYHTVTLTASPASSATFKYEINSGPVQTYSGAFAVIEGSNVNITAIPASGYAFSEWSNSEYTPMIFISSISADVSLTATNVQEFVKDGIKYKVGSTGGVNVVQYAYSGAIVIPDTVTYSGQTFDVVTIRNRAFYQNSLITSVTIGNKVASIENEAFYKSSISSLSLGSGLKTIGQSAFALCANLGPVTIPNGVTTIGGMAFNTSGITSVNIPDSITSIWDYAFNGCTLLPAINVSSGNAYYSSDSGILFNKAKTTLIQYPAGKTDLTVYTIPNTVTQIGNYSFYSTSLTKVQIHGDVTYIGAGAFNSCSGLSKIKMEGTAPASIGNNPFPSTASINVPKSAFQTYRSYWSGYLSQIETDVTLNITVTNAACSTASGPETIDNSGYTTTFTPDTGYELVVPTVVIESAPYTGFTFSSGTLTIPASDIDGNITITEVASRIYRDSNYNEYRVSDGVLYVTKGTSGSGIMEDFSMVSNLRSKLGISEDFTSVDMDSTMTTVGDCAFYGESDLTDIEMPAVVTIGMFAFSNCTSLALTELPDGITTLLTEAFSNCTSLALTELPDSIKVISSFVFDGCSALALTSYPDSINSVSRFAFRDCTNLAITSLHEGMTEIGECAFSGCSGITSMALPSSINSIDDEAFSGCTSLVSLTMPNNVAHIGINAFSLGTSGHSVTCHAYGCASGTLEPYKGSYTTFVYEGGYTVTYEIDGVQYEDVDTVYYGTNVTVRAKPTVTGYTVSDWTSSDVDVTGGSFVMPAKNVTITATKTPLKYTARISPGEGTCTGHTGSSWVTELSGSYSKMFDYGTTASAITDDFNGTFVKTGYTHTGFDKTAETLGTEGMIITAVYTINTYTVTLTADPVSSASFTYKIDDSATVTYSAPFTVGYGQSVTVTASPGSTYIFIKWADEVTDPTRTFTVSDNIELTAVCTNNFIVDGIRYILDSPTKVAVSTYTYSGSVTIPSSVTFSDRTFDVTRIAISAFYGRTALTSVTLPEGLTGIAGDAFHGCSSLSSIVIPSTVTFIGPGAFESCTSITSITIPNDTYVGEDNQFALGTSSIPVTCHVYGCAPGKLDECKNSYTTFIYEGGYTVTYKVNGEQYGDVDTVYYGANVTVRAKPTDTGYTFSDWTSADVDVTGGSFVMPAKNVTITATKTPNQYSVTLWGDPPESASFTFRIGSDDPVAYSAPFYVDYGQSVTVTATISPLYIFEKWNDDVTDLTRTFTVTGDVSLHTISVNEFVVDGKKYRIHAADEVKVRPNSYTGSVTIPSSVTYSERTFNVTTIGAYAFSECTGLTSVTIPDCVYTIERGAFSGCTSLPSVTLPSSLMSINYETFKNCTSLTAITIPANVTGIDSDAFKNCTGLATITVSGTIPAMIFSDSFTDTAAIVVPLSAFPSYLLYWSDYDSQIQTSANVTINATNATADKTTGNHTVTYSGFSVTFTPSSGYILIDPIVTIGGIEYTGFTFSSGTLTIPASAINGNIVITESAKYLYIDSNNNEYWVSDNVLYASKGTSGTGIMENFTSSQNLPTKLGITESFTSLSMDGTMTTVGEYAFYNYYKLGLSYASLPEVTTICDYAFYQCGISDVSMPKVISIGREAFYSSRLTLTSLPDSLTTIGNSAFSESKSLALTSLPSGVTTIDISAFSNCKNLALTSLPSGLTEISSSVFFGCKNLALTSLPSGITKIGSDSFYNCVNISLTSLPSGLTTINTYAFSGCTGLTSISIPSSVTSMGYGVFMGCTNLATVIMERAAPITQPGSAFPYTTAIEVPLSGFQSYRSSWSSYRSQIQTTAPVTINVTNVTADKTTGDHIVTNSGFSVTFTPSSGYRIVDPIVTIGGVEYTGFTFSSDTLTIPASAINGNISITENAAHVYKDSNNNEYWVSDNVLYASKGTSGTGVMENFTSSQNLPTKLGITESFSTVSMDGTMTTVGECAFCNMSGLTDISMPGVTSIGPNAFFGCTSLALTSLPSGITEIGDSAFYECTSLALTSLPSGITEIDRNAFAYCKKIALTSLPDGLTKISPSAFSGCTSLALTSLPSGITEIGNSAFYGCTSLALTSLPSGITEIYGYAFYGCTSLALTSLPSGITVICDKTFMNCTSVALTSLPDGLTLICTSAFYGCTSLALTSLPSGVTEIDSSAFSGCSNITSMALPSSLAFIYDYAFSGCTSLVSITVPNSLTTIGIESFGLGTSTSPVTCHVYGCAPGKLDSYKNSYTTFVYEGGYTVTYYLGTEVYETKTDCYYGDMIIVIGLPSVPGYTIGYWTSTDVDPTMAFIMPAKNVTITATKTPNQYNVTLDKNGGYYSGSAKVTFDEGSLTSIDPAKRYRYQVEGYYTSSDTTVKVANPDGTLIADVEGYTDEDGKWIRAADTTLYTKWEDMVYIITLYCQDGTNGSAKIRVGDTQFYDFTPGKFGDDNAKWYMDREVNIILADGNGVLRANVPNYTDSSGRWDPYNSYGPDITFAGLTEGTYYINFNSNGADGGTAVSQMDAVLGTGYPAPECTWTKTGKGFLEWNTESDGSGTGYLPGDILKDLTFVYQYHFTLYAIWDDLEYTVTLSASPADTATFRYKLDGGAEHDYTAPFQITAGHKLTLTAVPVTGYLFSKWSDDTATATKVISEVTDDVTLSAICIPDNHTVTLGSNLSGVLPFTYKIDDGEVQTYTAPFLVPHGSSLTVTAPSVTGYSFSKWDNDSTSSIRTDTIDDDTTWAATYSLNVHQVIYKVNGIQYGTPQDKSYGVEVTVIAKAVIEGHTVTDWITTDVTVVGGKFTMPDNDVTFTATATPNYYTATIKLAGGHVQSGLGDEWTLSGADYVKDFPYGTTASAITADFGATLYKEGYNHTGYDKTTQTIGTTGITITAQWALKQYTVTLVKDPAGSSMLYYWINDGTMTIYSSPFTIYHGQKLEVHCTASTGYTFTKWDNNSTDPDRTAYIGEDTAWTAICTPNNYHVTYKLDGNVYGDVDEEPYNSTVDVRAKAVKTGYTVTDWVTADVTVVSGQFTMPSKDVVFTATSTVNQYTATIKLDGGTVETGPGSGWNKSGDDYVKDFDYGTKASVITADFNSTLSKEGYSFSGYNKYEETMGIYGMTITALWTINTYTVTVSANPSGSAHFQYRIGSGSFNDYSAPFTVEHGKTVTLKVITNTGYTFKQWQDGSMSTTYTSAPITGNTTFTATSTLNSHSITYMLDSTPYHVISNQGYGTTVTVHEKAVKIGYNTTDWTTTDVTVVGGKFTMPDKNVTFYATSSPIHYTIKFFGNGNTGGTAVANINATYDVTYAAPGCTWIKTGNHFLNWNRDPYGSGTSYEVGDDLLNLTATDGDSIALYAIWELDEFTLTLTADPVSTLTFSVKINNGTPFIYSAPETIRYSDKVEVHVSDVTGHTFSKWDDASTNRDRTVSFVTGNISWTAESVLNDHIVLYLVNGEIFDQYAHSYGTEVTVIEKAVIEGHTVTDWITTDVTVVSGKFTMPDNDVTFTATATPNYYTATIKLEGGTVQSGLGEGWTLSGADYVKDFPYGTTASAITADFGATLQRTGFTHTGYDKTAQTIGTSGIIIKALWSLNTPTIVVTGAEYESGYYHKVYDGSNVTLTATGLPTSYQSITWYYDGSSHSTTGSSLNLVNVNESGVYYVVVTASGQSASSANVNIQIESATITGSIVQNGTLTYSGSELTATVTNTLTSVNSQTITVVYSKEKTGAYDSAIPAFKNAGTHTVYYKATAANHYERSDSFTVTIDKADLTLSDLVYSAPDSLTYSGTEKSASVAVKAGIEGAGQAQLTYHSDPERLYPATPIIVGKYYVKAFFTAGDNYNEGYFYGTDWDFTIAKTGLTVSAGTYDITYGDAKPEFTPTYIGFVNGETKDVLGGELVITCSYDTSDPDKRGYGAYDIALGGYTSGNYEISYTNGTLTVSPYESEVEWTTMSLIYSGSKMSVFSNLKTVAYPEDDPAVVSVLSTGDDVHVGSPFTYFAQYAVSSNYSLPSDLNKRISPTYTISPKGITVIQCGSVSKTYNGKDTGVALNLGTEYVFDGLVYGDSVDFKDNTCKFDSAHTNATKVIIIDTTLNNADYYVSWAELSASITPENIIVSGITAVNKTYDASIDATLDLSGMNIEGRVGSDIIGVTVEGKFTGMNVGSSLTVNLTYGPLANSDYTMNMYEQQLSATADITPAPLNVYPDNKTKKYGEEDPVFTYSYTGNYDVFDPIFTGALTRDPGEEAGPHTIRVGTLALEDNYDFKATNYTLVFHTGATLTIILRAITPNDFTVDVTDEIYNGDWIYKNIESDLEPEEDYRVIYINNKYPGTATIYLIGEGNYSGSLQYNFKILCRVVEVPASKQYKETGSEIQFEMPESKWYTETSGKAYSGTEPGTYSYTLALDPGCVWSDKSFDGIYKIYIGKAKVSVQDDNGKTIAYIESDKGIRTDYTISVKGSDDTSSIPAEFGFGDKARYVYTIRFFDGDKEVTPEGNIAVSLLIPSNLRTNVFHIYHIGTEATEVTFEKTDGFAKISAEQPYTYLFTDEYAGEPIQQPWAIAIIAILALCIVVALVIFFMRKDRR